MFIPFLNVAPDKFKRQIQDLLTEIPEKDRLEAKNFFVNGNYCLSTITIKLLIQHLTKNTSRTEADAKLMIEIIPKATIEKAVKVVINDNKRFTFEQKTYQICNNIIRYWNTIT